MIEIARTLLAGETILVLGLMMVLSLSRESFKRFEFSCLHLFLIGLLIWVGGIFLQLFLPTNEGFTWGSFEFFTLQILNLATTLFLLAQYGFARGYSNSQGRWRWWDYLVLLGFLFTEVLVLGKNTVARQITFFSSGNVEVLPGVWEGWFSFFTLGLILLAIITFGTRFFKTRNKILKKQLAYMFWGSLVFSFSGVLTNWILPAYFDFTLLDFSGPLFFIVMVACFYKAALTSRFLDLKLVLHRYLTFTTNLGIYSFGLWWIGTQGLAFIPLEFFGFFLLLLLGACWLLWNHSYYVLDKAFNYLIFHTKTNILEDLDTTFGYFDSSLQEGVKRLSKVLQVRRAELVFVDGDFMKTKAPLQQFFMAHPKDLLVEEELKFKLSQNKNTKLRRVQAEMEDLMLAAAIPVLGKDEKLLGLLLLEQKINGDLFSTQEIKGVKCLLEKATIYLSRERDYVSVLDKLQKKSEVKKEFLDGLMHEIRHPLMMARNVSEVIEWGKLRPEDQGFLRDSQTSLSDLSHKLDRVTLGAAWQAGNMVLSPSWNNLEDLGVYLEASFKGAKNLSFKLNSNLKRGLFRFDLNVLKEACIEVLNNGIDFNKAAVPVLELAIDKKENYLRFIFSDNGIGIAESRWEEVFSLMVVADPARNKDLSGVGAGLTIVRGMAEAHNGSVEIIKSSEKGTIVELLIRLETR